MEFANGGAANQGVESFQDVPIEQLEEDFLQLKAHLAVGECRSLLMLVEIERRGTWRNGYRSVAHWVSAVAGIDPGTAAARVRVAERLEHLPVVTAAFANGALTYSQTRAISRALREGADPERETELVGLAREMTAAQPEVVCRVMAGRTDDEADAAEQSIAFHITRHAGGGRITIDLPDVDVDRFLAAVDRRVQAEPAPDPGIPLEPLTRRRALAAVDLVVAASGEPDDCPAVNVIISLADYEAHLSGTLGDRPLAAAVIERLMCNGATRGIVVDPNEKPVTTGIECLVVLCRRCHHDHHHGRFTITIDDVTGDFHFWTSDGRPLHRQADVTGSADDLVTANRKAGVMIDPETIRSRWDGERLETKWIPGPDRPVPHEHVPQDASDGFELWNRSDDDWSVDDAWLAERGSAPN